VADEQTVLERQALDAAEALFAVMANVDMGQWNHQSPEWIEAAKRARTLYHQALNTAYPAVATAPLDPS